MLEHAFSNCQFQCLHSPITLSFRRMNTLLLSCLALSLSPFAQLGFQYTHSRWTFMDMALGHPCFFILLPIGVYIRRLQAFKLELCWLSTAADTQSERRISCIKYATSNSYTVGSSFTRERERVSTGQEVVHPSARLIKTIVMSHCTSNNPEEAANSHGSGSLVWSSGTVLGYSIFCSRTNLHSFTHTNFSSNIECNCPNRISI